MIVDSLLSKMRKLLRFNSKAGFTLTELIVVLIVLAIIAAISIPSVVGFIWHGQQINRMNIARTVYISMQNQLTRNLLEGNLREALTSHFYVLDAEGNLQVDPATGYYMLLPPNSANFPRVSELLGTDYPANPDEIAAGNERFVFTVMLPRGYNSLPAGHADRTPLRDDFYRLLDEIIINKDLLEDTFLMELNVRTGVVMSIFYGDNLGLGRQARFEYDDQADRENVIGGRGMSNAVNPYIFEYNRGQGYFGVDWTGEPLDIQLPDIADIFDGKNAGRPLEGRENVLYAELYVPKSRDTEVFIFDLISDSGRTSVLDWPNDIEIDLSVAANRADVRSLNELLFTAPHAALDGQLVYFPMNQVFAIDQFGVNVGPLYDKFVWVLDCVFGDSFVTDVHSIERYGIGNAQYVRARLERVGGVNNGLVTTSLTTDHSHYGGDISTDSYVVTSARHLSNIREFPAADFRQTEDINMLTDSGAAGAVPGAVTNFKPIESFSGTYTSVAVAAGAARPRILNLNIETDEMTDIGLFSTTYGATINGISLYQATVKTLGNSNVGAIAGQMNGGTIRFSYSYANVYGGGTTSSNTGGLVGESRVTGADGVNYGRPVIEQSFNAGFFDTNPATPGGALKTQTPGVNTSHFDNINGVFGSVTARGGCIGGLVGSNGGDILNCFNNARVNIDDVSDEEENLLFVEERSRDYLISVPTSPQPSYTPLAAGSEAHTFLGGIAGENASGGTINRVYATNFVAIYPIYTVRSGGIAGRNSDVPGSLISSSVHLENGCTNGIGRSVTKDELMSAADLIGGSGTQFILSSVVDYLEGFNDYVNYPYPVLQNNLMEKYTPGTIEEFGWGWEEIEGEQDEKLVIFTYYELYELTPWRGYDRGLENFPVPPGVRRLLDDRYVLHDGYAIELLPNTEGYTIFIGDERFFISFDEAVPGGVLVEDQLVDSGDDPVQTWPVIEEFRHLMPDNVTVDDMIRIIIPNHISEGWYLKALENHTGSGDFEFKWVAFSGYYDLTVSLADLEQLEEDDDDFEADDRIYYNPLFAPDIPQEPGKHIIRSPRQFENVRLLEARAEIPDYSQSYFQTLDLNFATYYKEILAPTLLWVNRYTQVNTAAVITGTFTGVYDGNSRYIIGVTIGNGVSSNATNAGLFARNTGIIERVTLKLASTTIAPPIIGGTNVGGIVGLNDRVGANPEGGIVRFCSVQHRINRLANGQLPAYAEHAAAVAGTTNVGGVVGSNISGLVHDVTVVSTSARPAVRGATNFSTANIGGIVGNTNTLADNLMYLAVAPRIATGRGAMRPFTGTGANIGNNIYYLAGTMALRPFMTHVPGLPAPSNVDDYNFISATHLLNTDSAGHTMEIVEFARTAQFGISWGNWSITNMANALVISQANQNFPYPYPTGTAIPEFDVWPIVVPFDPPPNIGIIYYEVYDGGGVGIYATYYINFEAGEIGVIDLLRYDNPVILEAGYGAEVTGVPQLNANRPALYSRNNGITANRFDPGGGGQQISLGSLPVLNVPLDGRSFRIIPQNLFINAATAGGGIYDPAEPFIVWINRETGNADNSLRVPALAAYVNPFFAKAVYPIHYTVPPSGIINGNIQSPQVHPDLFSVRTPWQLQNIQRLTSYNVPPSYTPAQGGSTSGMTFSQDVDIHFGTITRSSGAAFTYTETTQTMTGNGAGNGSGTRAVMNGATTGTTSNVVTGNFAGTYEGNARVIRSLSLLGTTANNKGLFNTILGQTTVPGSNPPEETIGTVRNVTLIDFRLQGGSNNGTVASVNNGVISDIALISTDAAAPVSGTGAGGIVSTNNGAIRNVLYLAHAPGNNPIAAVNSTTDPAMLRNLYYLSGTISLNNCPTAAPLASGNYNYNLPALIGEPRTTQELNALLNARLISLGFGDLWRQSTMPVTSNTMNPASTVYPYPILGTGIPTAWPIATISAQRLAYYEVYRDASGNTTRGFFSPAGSGLAEINTLIAPDDTRIITDWGYCAIVPRAGSYSIKYMPIQPAGTGLMSDNMHIQSETGNVGGSTIHYVRFTSNSTPITNINGAPIAAISANVFNIFVNDLPVDNANSRVINRLFAKGVYPDAAQAGAAAQPLYIRVPQQMRNINQSPAYPSTGRTYIQERDLDFTGINLNAAGAAVTGIFNGTYDGGGYLISGLYINYQQGTTGPPSPVSYVGLFSENNGTIARLTLAFKDEGTAVSRLTGIAYIGRSGTVYTGAIAGSNTGTIRDVSVVSSKYDASSQATSPVIGTSAGGIAGQNAGTVERVLYLAPAPESLTGPVTPIRPIVYENEIAGVTGTVSEAYYLFVDADQAAAIAGPDGLIMDLINGYNTAGTNGYGTPATTQQLNTNSAYWFANPAPPVTPQPNWASPPVPWTDTLPNTYPYQYIISIPAAWPVVGDSFIPSNIATIAAATSLTGFESIVLAYGKDSNDDPENRMLSMALITLYGGYSFTLARPFRRFMRRRNAIAIRKINEYNKRMKM